MRFSNNVRDVLKISRSMSVEARVEDRLRVMKSLYRMRTVMVRAVHRRVLSS